MHITGPTEISCNLSGLSLVLLRTLKCLHKYALEYLVPPIVYLKAAENPLHPEEQN